MNHSHDISPVFVIVVVTPKGRGVIWKVNKEITNSKNISAHLPNVAHKTIVLLETRGICLKITMELSTIVRFVILSLSGAKCSRVLPNWSFYL
jgi:hypothetical protein